MQKPADSKYLKGFTLLELLVVIAIIGVLVTIGVFGARGALQRARDSERKSDLNQYRNALEVYANNNNGVFPAGAMYASTDLCTQLELSGCPEDPQFESDPNFYYYYAGSVDGTEYVLSSRQESGSWWAVCSDGRIGEYPGMYSDYMCPIGGVSLPIDP